MRKALARLCLPLLLLFWSLTALPAMAAPLDMDSLQGLVALNHGEFSYLRDPSGKLTFANVRARDDQFQTVKGFLGQGFTQDTYWLRLTLARKTAPAGWWLQISPSSLDDLTLYLVRPDGSVMVKHSGDRQPLAVRDAFYSDFFFRLDVPPGESTLYLRVQTSASMTVMAHLQRLDRFPVEATTNFLLAGLYLGVIVTMVILGAVYLLINRQRLYAVYLVYLLCQLAFILCSQGMTSLYLLPELPAVSDRLRGATLSAMIVLGVLFFARLLQLDVDSRWRRSLCQLFAVVGAMTVIASAFGDFGLLAPWMWSMLLLVMVACLPPVARSLLRGSAEDRIFCASFLAFLVFVVSAALTSMGKIPITEVGRLVNKLGNVSHLLLLQITVMLRIRTAEREALLARQEVDYQQQRVAEQDQFIAMITHEIRTPMSVINAAADSLRLIDAEAAQPQREQRYERIAQAVKRVDHLIDIAVRRDRLHQTPDGELARVDLVALTQTVLAQLPAEQQQRTRLDIHEAPAFIHAYPELLQFSLLNLLDNAYKYSPADSPVSVHIDVSLREKTVSWAVTDQGPGVNEADRARIFDKYYRSAEPSGAPGLGLGLYIAHRLISRFDGELHYREQVAAGACFEVRLPLATNN